MIPFYLLAAADTLLVRQASPIRTGFEEVIFVAAGIAQIITPLVVALLAVIFYRMWKAHQEVIAQFSGLTAKLDPMLATATAAVENVRAVTDTVRKEGQRAAEAVTDAAGRMRDAVSGIADHIDDFGTLMGRAYNKADAVADVAGAAMTTIKWGKSAIKKRADRRHRPDGVARPVEAAAPPDDDEDHAFDHEPDRERERGREHDRSRDPAGRPGDVETRDEDRDDSPYASAATEAAPKSPRRRRRRGRGRRPPA